MLGACHFVAMRRLGCLVGAKEWGLRSMGFAVSGVCGQQKQRGICQADSSDRFVLC